MRLFEVGKIGCFCDAITHSIETRRDAEVKILTLTLRVSPFDAKLARAMPDGVRETLFKINKPDPKPNLRRVAFGALCDDRQVLTIYAAPDTSDPSFALDQVKISGTYAKVDKNRNNFEFVFKASFGPAGRDELEAVQAWLLSQRFVSFEPAEPGMFDDDEEDADEGDHDDDKPGPMWQDGDEKNPNRAAASDGEVEAPAPKKEAVRRKLHSHAAGKKAPGRTKARPLRGRRR
jgi:hypothetical protein